MELFSECRPAIVELVRRGLDRDRVTALGVAALLSIEERRQLFRELLSLASFEHGFIGKVRELILSLSHEWLLANIERETESLLQNGTDEEYRRLLELYSEIDQSLTIRLAQRAAAHNDGEIREVGEYFLKKLNSKSS
jgi:hypothetical protein